MTMFLKINKAYFTEIKQEIRNLDSNPSFTDQFF